MTTTQIILLAAAIVAVLTYLYISIGARRLQARREQRVGEGRSATDPSAPGPLKEAPDAILVAAPGLGADALPGDAADSPFLAAPDGAADDLSQIKGIGPKLSARLAELGVFHYAQIAGWTPAQLAIVDAQLGQFQGRPERDQWQAQARLLAAGDRKAFERTHGKLGQQATPPDGTSPGGTA